MVNDTVYAEGDDAPLHNVSSASATIDFERGKSLFIEGVDNGGSPFQAEWTPKEAHIEQVKPGETFAAAGEIERTDYRTSASARLNRELLRLSKA